VEAGSSDPARGSAFAGIVLTLLFLFAANTTLHACPVCFQVEENATTDGVQLAVLVLMGVTTGVLGGFAAFIVRFVRRASRSQP
jgi:heme/copper-type cytochrome/quinol oxidase subunit 2